MIRIVVALGIALLWMAAPAVPGTGAPSENSYVKFTAKLKPGTPRARTAGEVHFTLRPQKGIHINLEPAMSLSFDSGAAAKAEGKLEVPRMEKFPYLDTTKSVVQRFTLAGPGQTGKTTVRGVLTYYYCSDAEGWCSKFKQPFALTLPAGK
jgi:hypothetical protein